MFSPVIYDFRTFYFILLYYNHIGESLLKQFFSFYLIYSVLTPANFYDRVVLGLRRVQSNFTETRNVIYVRDGKANKGTAITSPAHGFCYNAAK